MLSNVITVKVFDLKLHLFYLSINRCKVERKENVITTKVC